MCRKAESAAVKEEREKAAAAAQAQGLDASSLGTEGADYGAGGGGGLGGGGGGGGGSYSGRGLVDEGEIRQLVNALRETVSKMEDQHNQELKAMVNKVRSLQVTPASRRRGRRCPMGGLRTRVHASFLRITRPHPRAWARSHVHTHTHTDKHTHVHTHTPARV